MNNTLTYKRYTGSVEYSREDGVLWGRVLGIRHIIDFEGESISDLEKDFHAGVDHYLKVCREEGIKPNKPRPGKITLTIPPEIEAGLEGVTEKTGKSANQLFLDAVRALYFDGAAEQIPPKRKAGKQRSAAAGAR